MCTSDVLKKRFNKSFVSTIHDAPFVVNRIHQNNVLVRKKDIVMQNAKEDDGNCIRSITRQSFEFAIMGRRRKRISVYISFV